MKKPLKILIFVLMLALLISALVINTLAEEETPKKLYSVVYQYNDSVCNNDKHDHYGVQFYEEGETVTVSSDICGNGANSGETFLGWFSDDGVLYKTGQTFQISRNMVFYVACGKDISSASDLKSYLNDSGAGNYWNYARLTADITLNNQTINASWHWQNTGVIDLNGHTITSTNVQYGFGAQRTGLIFVGKGTINFTSNKPLEGAFFNTSWHSYGDGQQRLWIGKDVKIVSNAPLIRLTNSMTPIAGKPTIRIYGDITAPYLLWSYGALGIDVNIYSTAKITIPKGSLQALLYDSSVELGNIANLNIMGGTFNLPEDFKGFVTTIDGALDERLTFKITGGTFNRDISTLIPISLKVVENADGTFSILPNPCSKAPEGSNGLHRYVATQIGVDCVTSGEIHYSCIYCQEAGCDGEGGDCLCEYTIKREAFGHSFISVLTKDMVNTKKETEPAESTLTCTRCGLVEKQYESPDPTTVYVTIKLKYTRDVNGSPVTYQDTIRIPSSLAFGFDVDSTYGDGFTYLNSFGTSNLTYKFDDGREERFQQSEIVGIEIPLGTTRIRKDLFKGNENLEWIKLREGLMYIEDNVFAEMPNLKVIEGIENIQDYIGSGAFAQKDSETPVVLDSIELNAKTVGTNAFKNILAKRVIIHDNVRRLKNAFALDGNTSKYEKANDVMCEIFIDKLSRDYNLVETPGMFGITIDDPKLTALWSEYFEEFYHASALLKRGVVYYDHNYIETTHQPTCKQNGFVAHECSQCGDYDVIEIIPNTGITHVWKEAESLPATCMQAGAVRELCTRCGDYKIISEIPVNPNKHDFSTTDPEPTPGACTSIDWEYRRRCAYGCGTWSSNKYKAGDKIILGHTYSNDPADIIIVKPTCGNPGQEIKVCTRCLEETITETPANGTHSWVRNDSGYIAPTCGADGVVSYRCTVCEATDSEAVAKLTYEEAKEKGLHKWTEEVILEPTTKKTGYKRVYCSICSANRQDAQTIIPKLKRDVFLGFIPMIDGMSMTTAWIIFGVVMALLAGGAGILVFFLVAKKKNKSTSYKYKFNTFKR